MMLPQSCLIIILSDVAFCSNDTYTYFSDSSESMSWIDHIVSTHSANNLIDDVWVDYSFISSDHHPLLCTINVDNVVSDDTVFNDVIHRSKVIKWDALSREELIMYKDLTSDTLSKVELNHEMILCDDPHCNSQSHKSAICRMYSDITVALKQASKSLISGNRSFNHEYVK